MSDDDHITILDSCTLIRNGLADQLGKPIAIFDDWQPSYWEYLDGQSYSPSIRFSA